MRKRQNFRKLAETSKRLKTIIMAEQLNELTDQELLEKKKKSRSDKIMNAVLIGFSIGIAVYSSVTYGIGFLHFFR